MLVLPAVFSQFFQLKILNVILVKEGQLDEIAEVTECHSANENDTVYTPQFYEGSYDKTFDRSNSGDREVSFRERTFFNCFLQKLRITLCSFGRNKARDQSNNKPVDYAVV